MSFPESSIDCPLFGLRVRTSGCTPMGMAVESLQDLKFVPLERLLQSELDGVPPAFLSRSGSPFVERSWELRYWERLLGSPESMATVMPIATVSSTSR